MFGVVKNYLIKASGMLLVQSNSKMGTLKDNKDSVVKLLMKLF